MRILGYRELKDAPKDSIVALGFFDGVHIAHRKLLSDAKAMAKENGRHFGIITFSSESDVKKGSPRLYSTEERLGLFEKIGADFTVLLDFSEIKSLSPEDFVKKILVKGIHASTAFVGYNFRFGKGALADAIELSSLMKQNGRNTVICDEIKYEGAPISATLIRSLIEKGEIEKANLLLGSPYFISGVVTHGNGVGNSLGFPTVNTPFTEGKIIPKPGVYRSIVKIFQNLYNGVTNIGVCPTFDKREIHEETYVIDFKEQIYGENITVYLLGYLREERAFDSPEELITQIKVDVNSAINKNGEEKWQELGLK